MRVVVLAGGIGGARFLRGLRAAVPAAELTALVNTGDDVTLHGLRICPDLDTVMYTLGGGIDPDRGWGRRDESWRVKAELAAYGAEPAWFGLGDLDLATHLVRTRMLDAGYPLSAVTEALCDRWRPGVRLLPMSDDRVETHVLVDRDEPGTEAAGPLRGRKAIHFQEWWVRHRAALPAHGFVQVGVADAKPAPGVLDALAAADAVLFAPSNPVVSVGTVLAVPGHPGGGPRHARAGWSRCPRSSAARRCAGWRTPACPRSGCRRPRRRSAAGTARAPGARTGCSTAGWWTPRTPARRCRGWRCGRCRC